MKKIFVSTVLIITMVISSSAAFGASNNNDFSSFNYSPSQKTINQLNKNVSIIEQDLEKQGTSVEDEICKQIEELEQLKAEAFDPNEKEKIQNLIDTTESLLAEYALYKTSNENMKADANDSVIMGNHNTVYEPAITAVIAWFGSKKYSLSAECLTYASNNNKLNITYTPVNGPKAKNSQVIKDIKLGSLNNGQGVFPNSGTVADKDLYYAINGFNWIKVGSVIQLRDRYDFVPGSYAGIAGIAVDTMFLAQQAGALVPFYIYLPL